MRTEQHVHEDEEQPRPEYVRCWPPVAIEVEQDGTWWPGTALAYRGQRVSVEFRTGPGQTYHQAIDASRVRRS